MVAVASALAGSTLTRSASAPPTAPRVTVKVSSASPRSSTVTGIATVWVDPATESAGKVTVPLEGL